MDAYIQQRSTIIDAFEALIAKTTAVNASVNHDIEQIELMNHINLIAIHTENFWVQNAASNEMLTRRFMGRKLQPAAPEVVEISRRENIDTPAAAVPQVNAAAIRAQADQGQRQSNTRFGKGQNKATTYDIRMSLRATLDINYIDERGPADKRPLEVWRYSELISNSDVVKIVRWMLKEHHYGPLLFFWTVLATTKEYVQLAIIPDVLSLMFDLVTDEPSPFTVKNVYMNVIHHVLFYTMYILYKEECYLRSYIIPEHRCLLDLESAVRLPIHIGPIEESPYVPLSLSPQILINSSKTSILKNIYETVGTWRGFYNTEEFKRRFRVFTGGLFEGLNTDRLWICGSCIPACAVRSPLEQLFIRGLNMNDSYKLTDEELLAYFEEFYPSLAALEHTYFDEASGLANADVEAAVSDVDIIVHINDDEDFDLYAKMIYDHVQARIRESPDADTAVIQLRKVETSISYKYYISIDKGTRRWPGIEIFRIFETHPVGGISRFHVPMVRGVYDGQNVKVFPSLISYAMTGYLLDFRWVSCVKDAKDILIRYHLRGGSFIVNENEDADLRAHVNISSKWADVKRYLLSNNARDINNPLYKPRQQGHSFWKMLKSYDTANNHTYNWIEPSSSATAAWMSNLPQFNPLRYNNGSIQPIALWTVRAYVEALMRSATFI